MINTRLSAYGLVCVMLCIMTIANAQPVSRSIIRAEDTEQAAGPVAVGPALDGDIVALYLPPTRPANVYAATRQKVYAYDSKSSTWSEVYCKPPECDAILGLAGYAKSSSVLYVVHSAGVAVTHDSGATWESSSPPGFRSAPRSIAKIAVNPAERQEAVLTTGREAWCTRDFGKTWTPLSLPSASESVSAVGYTAGKAPCLVAAAGNAIYSSGDLGKTWSGPISKASSPILMAVSSASSLVLIYDRTQAIRCSDLSRPGRSLEREAHLAQAADAVTVDCEGRGIVWMTSGNRVFLRNLQQSEDDTAQIHEATSAVRNLNAHPRSPETVVWTQGPQVWKMNNAAAKTVAQSGQSLFGEPASEAQSASVPNDDVGQNPEPMLEELLKSGPTVAQAVAAALRYANYRPDEIERWLKNARRRNLAPQVALEFGQREYPLSVWDSVVNKDRYGIERPDDLHSSDRIAGLDRYSIQLKWDLGRLLFDRDEVYISEEARRRATERNGLIKEVSQLYYNRLELMVGECTNRSSMDAKERLNLRLRVSEATDTLNQICGESLFTTGNPLLLLEKPSKVP